jgi:hypothetical protein
MLPMSPGSTLRWSPRQKGSCLGWKRSSAAQRSHPADIFRGLIGHKVPCFSSPLAVKSSSSSAPLSANNRKSRDAWVGQKQRLQKRAKMVDSAV